MYRLLFQSGGNKGRRLVIRQGPVILGRHPDCTIRLPDQGVALQHAILEDQPHGGVRLRRLANDLVLRVNQRDVTEADLRHGDRIEVGPHLFEFQNGSSVAGVEPTKRRLGLMQKLTLLAVGFLLIGQMAFLFTISVWKHGPSSMGVPAKSMTSAGAKEPAIERSLPPPVTVSVPENVAIAPPPPVLASNTPPPVATAGLSNEIQQMQREIVQLNKDVAALPKPTPMTNAAPLPMVSNTVSPAVEIDDPVLVQAQRMLKKTLGHADQLDPEALDGEFETIQKMAPDFVPTYIEHAQTLERRGLPQAALTQWRQVQKLTKDAGLRTRAAEEIKRLKMLSTFEIHNKVATTSVVAGAAPLLTKALPVVVSMPRFKPQRAIHPVVRLAQVEQQKFMAGEKYDEMRVLRIIVAPVAGTVPFDPAGLELQVTFFDRDEKSGHVAPSRATVPGTALRAPPTAVAGVPLEFNATYQVPRGFWQQETQRSGRTQNYFGYRVELVYRGELHDQREQPPGLLPAE